MARPGTGPGRWPIRTGLFRRTSRSIRPRSTSAPMGLVAIVLWRLRAASARASSSRSNLIAAGLERFLVGFVRRNDDVALAYPGAAAELAMMAAGGVWLVVASGGRTRAEPGGSSTLRRPGHGALSLRTLRGVGEPRRRADHVPVRYLARSEQTRRRGPRTPPACRADRPGPRRGDSLGLLERA